MNDENDIKLLSANHIKVPNVLLHKFHHLNLMLNVKENLLLMA